jgi:hypothetical protein
MLDYVQALLRLNSFGPGARNRRPARGPKRNRLRPVVEGLEDRSVPAVMGFPTAQQVLLGLQGGATAAVHHGHHHAHVAAPTHHHGRHQGASPTAIAAQLAALQAQNYIPLTGGENPSGPTSGSTGTATGGTVSTPVTPTPTPTPTPVPITGTTGGTSSAVLPTRPGVTSVSEGPGQRPTTTAGGTSATPQATSVSTTQVTPRPLITSTNPPAK